MQTLDIEKFNPTRAEITTMVEKFKNLTIAGVDDVAGYLVVDEARKQLKRSRVQIEKDGKLLRSEALAFQKAVIVKEKELVAMIEPTEKDLEAKQNAIDEEKEKLKRVKLLPERKIRLGLIGVTIQDDLLLIMDEDKFNQFYNIKNEEYLVEKERLMAEAQKEAERKIKEEQDKIEIEKKKIEEEKLSIEREKQKQIDLQKAREEEAIRVKKEMEEKIERDKQAALLNAKREEERKVKEEQDRVEKEKKDQAALEARKKYQTFLASHEWKEGGEGFYIQKLPDKIVLYKQVGEFKL